MMERSKRGRIHIEEGEKRSGKEEAMRERNDAERE